MCGLTAKEKLPENKSQSIAYNSNGRDWMECWQDDGREENFSSQQNTEPVKFRVWQTKQISN